MKKRLIAMLLAALTLLACAAPAMAAAPKIRRTEYEGNGVVDVDFRSNHVRYRNAKVVVKDADGKRYTAVILEKDNDDMTFKVKNIKSGARYTYTVSGIRDGATGSYGSASGSFRTPSDKPAIEQVDYDWEDRELEVEFATRVQFQNPRMVVKDASGNKLTVRILDRDWDSIEARVDGIVRGETYTVTVYGVRVKDKGEYTRATRRFVA